MQHDRVTKAEDTDGRLNPRPEAVQAEAYRCPVCHQVIPPEHLGRKICCRKCGYLESCCNPE